jgi:hypothetical protein
LSAIEDIPFAPNQFICTKAYNFFPIIQNSHFTFSTYPVLILFFWIAFVMEGALSHQGGSP